MKTALLPLIALALAVAACTSPEPTPTGTYTPGPCDEVYGQTLPAECFKADKPTRPRNPGDPVVDTR